MRHLGIDLGTTNSVAAIDGTVVRPQTARDAPGILPSVVAYPPNGGTLIGTAAKERRSIDPKNTIYSSKRIIGATWHAYRTTKFRRQYPFELIEEVPIPFGVSMKRSAGTEANELLVAAE